MRHSPVGRQARAAGLRWPARADSGGVMPAGLRPGGGGSGRSPKFSIIIAVHNTAEFLPSCVESILGQSLPDFELIAVDDASTDGSRELLSDFAARDPRVRVVSLQRNGGAGVARNAGFKQARGDYIWFVDSDDWVDRDSLSRIARRLEIDDPEVLLFGWSRRYPDGQASGCPAAAHLSAAPARFTLHEWPRAIRILHTPWNKVVSRELIERTGFAFVSGWYQDLSFTYSMLAAARRISALPDKLVHYRQRPSGAMSTRGAGHLAVLGQWSSVFRLVGEHSPRPDLLQADLFDRMAWHLLEVIRKPERVPREYWKAYMHGARRLWAEHQPAGYRFPTGAIGIRHRMMAGKLPFARLVPFCARAGARVRTLLGLPAAGRLPDQPGEDVTQSTTVQVVTPTPVAAAAAAAAAS